MTEGGHQRATLPGRGRELASLRDWRAAALAGHGRLVLLTGPPGIGKTRLAEQVAEEAHSHGQRVLWGRAVDERGAPPLWPWRRILTGVGADPDGDALVGGGALAGARSDDLTAAKFRAAAAVADRLISAAGSEDLMVILEDLQWADHASLFLLRELAADLPASRLIVLATCRDTAGDPWRVALGELARLPGLRALPLAPLSEADVAEVMAGTGLAADTALARIVHARSEGNPLYVTTLTRLLAARPDVLLDAEGIARVAGRSPEIRHLVSALLRECDDDTGPVLAAASVLGTEFDADLAATVCAAGRDVSSALTAAESAGLVIPLPSRPGSWRFAHALIRDGIYAMLPDAERTALHGRAAAALEQLVGEAPQRGGEIAAHLLRSSPDTVALRQAATWAAAAATAGTAALAFDDATVCLTTALAAAEAAGADAAEHAELLIGLATAEYRAGQLGASLQHAVAAADLAEPAGRFDLVASAALVMRGIGNDPVATTLLGLCNRALAAADCAATVRAQLLAQRASALAELGDMAGAATESAAAMSLAEQTGDPAAELEATRARVAALAAPQHYAERLRLGTRTIELAAAVGQPIAEVLGHVWRIDAAYQLGNLATVDDEIRQISALADSTRLPLARWHLLRQQASRAALTGQFAFARDRSWEAHRLATRIEDTSGASLSYSFAIWLAVVRGDAGEIPADFFDHARAWPPLPIVRAFVAAALFALGRTDEARSVYETLRHLPAAGDADTRILGALQQLVELIVVFRDTELAQAAYDLVIPHVTDTGVAGTGVVMVDGSPHRKLGRLAALIGRTDDALEHFACAVRANARVGARPFVALAKLDWADVLRSRAGRGDQEQALLLARQAAAEAGRLDMPGPAARAERLLLQIEEAANPLTRREREIAELISAGLSNRAIADKLVLSERTIEGHVRSILIKLQFTNRTELAAWALRNARTT